jgi:ubiquinone/menaquinone biosynthesis C-methylase UbiE
VRVDTAAVENAAEYYDERHERGWMDHWPDGKKARVIGLIQEFGLPPGAKVLEYGCGVGVFTEAMKRALPQLEVHGCDISATGVRKASNRCPDIPFHLLGQSDLTALRGQFDVIYTHHVLEHVTDLDQALDTIAQLLKPGGRVLHIVPCSNPGSLEQRISSLIDPDVDPNGRFSSDDSSHLRRPSSSQLIAAMSPHGFGFERALYANQFWGGIEYLTAQYHWTLLEWLNPARGFSSIAKIRLFILAAWLLPLALLRQGPRYVLQGLAKRSSTAKLLFFACLSPLAVVAYPFSIGVDKLVRALRDAEWRRGRQGSGGSEMYAMFRKSATAEL